MTHYPEILYYNIRLYNSYSLVANKLDTVNLNIPIPKAYNLVSINKNYYRVNYIINEHNKIIFLVSKSLNYTESLTGIDIILEN